jgi:hypothetical protein
MISSALSPALIQVNGVNIPSVVPLPVPLDAIHDASANKRPMEVFDGLFRKRYLGADRQTFEKENSDRRAILAMSLKERSLPDMKTR